MKNLFVIISLTSVFILGCKQKTTINKSVKKNNVQIDSLMNSYFNQGIFNGNILVAKNDTILFEKSFGFSNGTKTKKLNLNHVFNIGSISKELSGVAIMKLVEEGKISLNDTVAKFQLALPSWVNKITISNLLDYTSGLPKYNWDTVRTDDDVYNDLKNIKKLNFQPNTDFLYSNNNIFLRKLIIQKVSGLTYNQYIRTNILEPLYMDNTYLTPIEEKENFAVAFNNQGENYKEIYQMSGGSFSSVKDMHTWIKALHKGKIISKKSILTLSKGFGKNQSTLGYSRFIDGKFSIHRHHGSNVDFESIIYHDLRDHFTIILLTNNKNNKLWNIIYSIIPLIR